MVFIAPKTFALFYLEEIARFKSPFAEALHISLFFDVYRNLTKT